MSTPIRRATPRALLAMAVALAGAVAFAGCGGDEPAASTSAGTTGAVDRRADIPAAVKEKLAQSPETEVTDDPDEVPWSYSGATGPARWASLSPEYEACAGTSQTPIDIVNPVEGTAPLAEPSYKAGAADVFNNGHTVVATAAEGSELVVGDTASALVQMHFHAPSEHEFAGTRPPAEVHFVHTDDAGVFTVVGAAVEGGGATNAAWQPFVDAVATPEGKTATATLDWPGMLPADLSGVRYTGSLTTPPCTEGVRWIVLTSRVTLSNAQLKALQAAYANNSRPVQPLNGRTITEVPDTAG